MYGLAKLLDNILIAEGESDQSAWPSMEQIGNKMVVGCPLRLFVYLSLELGIIIGRRMCWIVTEATRQTLQAGKVQSRTLKELDRGSSAA